MSLMATEGEYERYKKSSALYDYDVSKSYFPELR